MQENEGTEAVEEQRPVVTVVEDGLLVLREYLSFFSETRK